MKKILYSFIALAAASVLIFGCSIEKRVHLPGYHVEWHNKKEKETKKHEKDLEQEVKNEESGKHETTTGASPAGIAFDEKAVSASAEKEIVLSKPIKLLLPANEIAAVSEKQDNPSDPQEKTSSKSGKKNKETKKDFGSKNAFLAALLCLLLGVFGIHRFYLGYTGIGILQLFTCGGCGIWATIDLIRILTDDLQPKYGGYKRPLEKSEKTTILVIWIVIAMINLIANMIAMSNSY